MANKIYDFLPAHLRNRDLEDIFDTTLERVFSKGNLAKTRAYVGRREKGLNNEENNYLSFPEHLYSRDNYGLEPVFTNDAIKDRIFYDDLLNSMFNKGMLTNDHRRLFKSTHNTINLPIDADKFVNWHMYYWALPLPLYIHVKDENGFAVYESDGSPKIKRYIANDLHVHVNHVGINLTKNIATRYITIDTGASNYWSENNQWFHYDDIRHLIKSSSGITMVDLSTVDNIDDIPESDREEVFYVKTDNTELFLQAKRPIIEFDNRLVPTNNESVSETNWTIPLFELYNEDGTGAGMDYSIFEYVVDDLYQIDPYVGLRTKVKSGDYNSEFVFQITIPEGKTYRLEIENNYDIYNELYTKSEFNYRNLRQELGNTTVETISLPQRAKSNNDIDVYVDGLKLNENYSVVDKNTVVFDKPVTGDVYVDYCTKDPVDIDGDRIWQRIDPIVEYNVDNETHHLVEMTYSVFYEHFLRQIETTDGLVGAANSHNNYRNLGTDTKDKTRFNQFGSVIITHDTDVRKGYFAITRDDFDPIKSVEFLAGSFSSYKNKLILQIRELLKEDYLNSKSNLEILETAVQNISKLKRENIDIFNGSDMIVMGNEYNHYIEKDLGIVLGGLEHSVPSEIKIVDDKNVVIILNDTILKLNKDYKVSDSGLYVTFTSYEVKPEDNIKIRYYSQLAETFIPPSATKLGISALYEPKTFIDNNYPTPVTFIMGHDGSVTPGWGDRTDDILLMFETLVYNRNTDKSTEKTNHSYGFYGSYSSEYTFAEKRFMAYPFFKKWMIKNNIDELRNTAFDINNWKTWNYRAISDDIPGSWRAILNYVYNTEFIFTQPWLTLGLTERPQEELFGWIEDDGYEALGGYFEDVDFTAYSFWDQLKTRAGATWPIPVDANGNLRDILTLFNLQADDKQILKQDWEFGDGSPEELAWRRNSEYPFVEFLMMIQQNPFKVLDDYDTQIRNIVDYYNKREGYSVATTIGERDGYTFKLGSKLGGFVNNFKLFSERNSFSNSNVSEIPKDNYDLFVHAGEPNRSESFSAIIIEKVSLDAQYPFYTVGDTASYKIGDIVLRQNDGKYYKRKSEAQTTKEIEKINEEGYFDYSAWVLVSQPNVKKFGYRISGYDDFNPVFYTLDWDKTSGVKRWSSSGDLANLKQWTAGEYYKNDSYTEFNHKPYISLEAHQASESFDKDLSDGKWKLVREWPLVNTIDAVGYKEVLQDQLKVHNYGDILETLSDVAQLFVGYQEYLKLVGWDFTDLDEFSEVVDFESLLIQFLDWSREIHQVGDFITLTPILRTGRFDTPYGVATVGRPNNKNFYRVVDSSGRQLPKTAIKFNIDGNGIVWESDIPVYGIKVDIQDIEHAMVIDREDSFGDTIYDPLTHNRNLRMLIDCNRTADWDGTLAVDGFIASDGELLPNFETMVEESRYYRDTLVDQSLEIINKLKAAHLGFFPRTYLSNHFIDRESQLEFHKGFLAGKGTKQSVNRIINKNSNFADVEHEEVWAFKLKEYGKTGNRKVTDAKILRKEQINSDPLKVQWDENGQFALKEDGWYRNHPIMTSGYVNPDHVNYVVRNSSILENTVRDTFYEGDLAWIRFDDEREWDVKRLSEISEIVYIGETEDGQLYIGLTNEVDINDAVFLKISALDVDPAINGYYNLVDDGTKEQNGQTVYEYLVYDTDYEPIIVEIDTTTNNSVYVPTPEDTGVQAIGSVSNPQFFDGDRLIINGTPYVYTSDGDTASYGLSIGGQTATIDPNVTAGDEGRIIVYDINGNQLNTETVVRFGGGAISADTSTTSDVGDTFTINGVSITVDYGSETRINLQSDIDENDTISSGLEMQIQGDAGGDYIDVESKDIEIVGTITNPLLYNTKSMNINGTVVSFVVPDDTIPNSKEEPRQSVTTPVSTLDLNNDHTLYTVDSIELTDSNGTRTLSSSEFTYNSTTGEISFTTAITDITQDENGDDVNNDVGFIISLTGIPQPNPLDINDIISIITASAAPVTPVNRNGVLVFETGLSYIEITGSILVDLGLSSNDVIVRSKLLDIRQELSLQSFFDVNVDGSGKLIIDTSADSLTITGSLAERLGLDGSYAATTSPTAFSVANQIVSANIPLVTASTIGGNIVVSSSGNSIEIEAATSDILNRLGFNTTSTVITAETIDSIIADINAVLPSNTRAEKYAGTNRIVISSSAGSIEILNYDGNPWDDLGIATGTYNNTVPNVASVQLFKEQINAAANDIVVSVSSDGRMVFTSSAVGLTFGGTDTSVLEKIGLYTDYTNVTSNANFKIMRWKSVRYTPNFEHISYDDFESELGLNTASKIWADDYKDLGNGWAVVEFNPVGTNKIIAKQVNNLVDIDMINRLIIKDGDVFHNYQLFDPLNLKMPGSIIKDIDYVDWNDPAKYDDEYSEDMWLGEHEGDIWWDTSTARYYRYNDYGDANGNIDVDYVKRFWGKLLSGSKITIKQWKSSNTVPEDVSWFNTETYWDTGRNVRVTRYHFWSTVGIEVTDKEYSINEIRMLIESGGVTDKFIPIDDRTVIISNNEQFNNDTIEYRVDRFTNEDIEPQHVDWQLMKRNGNMPIDNAYLNELRDSIVGNGILVYTETYNETNSNATNNKITLPDDDNEETGYVSFTANASDTVVTINNSPVSLLDIEIMSGYDIVFADQLTTGDVVRVYKISEFNSWFKNLNHARDNFASIVNDYFEDTLLERVFPRYEEHIALGDGILQANNWYISSEFKDIDSYQYLSKTRNFDMIKMYKDGIESFRVELDEGDEYYFNFRNNLQLVHKERGSMRVSYTDFNPDAVETELLSYSKNIEAVQTYELINMLYEYADNKFIKNMFFDMIDYMYTEKTYPDWIFKTSYIDLFMMNKPLRQYAIYQNDNYNDIIDYVNETKPYHTKIRETERVYPYAETMPTDVDIYEAMELELRFGGYSRYKDNIIDGGDQTIISGEVLGLDIYTLEESIPDNLKRLYHLYTYNKHLIQLVRQNPEHKMNEEQQEIINEWISLTNQYLVNVRNQDYDAGGLLRRFNTQTWEEGGYDTGEFDTHLRESMVFRINSGDNRQFVIYDMFGRGYYMDIDGTAVLDSFDGKTLTTSYENLRHAKDDTIMLIALENNDNEIEFMMYDSKKDTSYNISHRAIFNGIASKFIQGDTIYILSKPYKITDGEVRKLFDLELVQ